MDVISSLSNSRVKRVRALKHRKHRSESGLFLVEGIHHVGEAVNATQEGNAHLEEIYYAPDLLKSDFANDLIQQQVEQGVPCFATTELVFNSLADRENPQGILAVLHARRFFLTELSPENFPWGVALMAPQDPGNVGTILRTIDAVGASGLLLLDSSVDPYYPGAVRASMGTLFWYPVVRVSFTDFVNWSSQQGYHVYGTSAHARVDYREVKVYERPLILLMGSERDGLTSKQAAVCDEVVRMPMRGRETSLNLAVATGIMSYAILDKLAE